MEPVQIHTYQHDDSGASLPEINPLEDPSDDLNDDSDSGDRGETAILLVFTTLHQMEGWQELMDRGLMKLLLGRGV
eukprot:9018561-Ditylum_brightwellii.AAC.1